MKITLNIDAQLVSKAQARARATGTTLTRVVETALAEYVGKAPPRSAPFVLELPRWDSGADAQGVDLASRERWLDVLHADADARLLSALHGPDAPGDAPSG